MNYASNFQGKRLGRRPPRENAESLWQGGPFTNASQPVQHISSQNMDMSTFPLLLESVYSDLEMAHSYLQRLMPFCAFQHVYTSILSATLIHQARVLNPGDRYTDEDSPMYLIPDDMIIPAPVAEYYKMITSTKTPYGYWVYLNLPDSGIPHRSIESQDALPAVPSGSFGRLTPENHNAYECYVSPLVTSRLVTATRDQNTTHHYGEWFPLPDGCYPPGSTPNSNLLGYRQNVEHLDGAGLSALLNVQFPNSDDMEGCLCWSSELVARVNATLKRMATSYKMVVGRPRPGTNSAAIGWTRVDCNGDNASQNNTVRLSTINGSVQSSVAMGSSDCNIVGIFGLKRERTQTAPGLCYTINGVAPHGWIEHINDNFTMAGEFAPNIGSDLPELRYEGHTSISPSGDRGLVIASWLRRNFLVRGK